MPTKKVEVMQRFLITYELSLAGIGKDKYTETGSIGVPSLTAEGAKATFQGLIDGAPGIMNDGTLWPLKTGAVLKIKSCKPAAK